MPDDQRDLPEQKGWSDANAARFLTGTKRLASGVDVIDWFNNRAPGEGYHTIVNRGLREYVSQCNHEFYDMSYMFDRSVTSNSNDILHGQDLWHFTEVAGEFSGKAIIILTLLTSSESLKFIVQRA